MPLKDEVEKKTKEKLKVEKSNWLNGQQFVYETTHLWARLPLQLYYYYHYYYYH